MKQIAVLFTFFTDIKKTVGYQSKLGIGKGRDTGQIRRLRKRNRESLN